MKKNKTPKEMIMTKSYALFWSKGYSETSMKDIADACNFKPANIYNFFKSKEEILYQILYSEMEEIVAPIRHFENDKNTSPPDQLKKVIENHLRITLTVKRTSMLLFDGGLGNLSPGNQKKIIKLRDEYDRITRSIIRRGIKNGFFAETDEKMAVFCIASMIVRTRIWYSPKGRYSVDDIIDFIYNFALKGLRDNKQK